VKIFAASAGGLRPKDTRGHFFLPEEGGFGAFSVSSARGFLCGRSALKYKRENRNFLYQTFLFRFLGFCLKSDPPSDRAPPYSPPGECRGLGVEATLRAAHRVKWCFRPQSSSLFMVWTEENARFHGNRPTIGRLRSAFRRWLFFPLFGRWRELDLSAADGSNSCRRVPMS